MKLKIRPPVNRPEFPRFGLPSGTHNQLFFCIDNWVILDVRRPLWREDESVIYSYNCFWALPEQSLLGRSPAELSAIFSCLIWDSSHLEGQVPVFISPRNRVAQLYPRALGSLLSPYTASTRVFKDSNVS
jgi:hypothetical protein